MKKYITKFSTTEEYESALAMLDFPNTSQVGSNIVFAPNEPEGKVRFINVGGVSVKSVACGVDNTITSSDSNGVRISGGSVEIGECATGLGTGAFATIQDAEIKGMPAEWLIDIPDSAFGMAYPEEGFDLSETQFIGNEAFRQNSHITGALTLPEVVSIGDDAFYYCGQITSVVIGDNCTEIGDMAFNNASGLSSITLGSGLTRIGSDCFNYTSWYNSQSNNSILYIGNWAVGHKGYSIYSVTVPSGITHIADSAFGNLSNLTNVTLPEGLVSIGARAFVNCNPTELVIPSTVEYIGDQAVLYCESTLSYIIIKATTPPELGSEVFVYGNYPIYVPAESLADYKEAWPEVENRLFAIPTGTKATLTYLNGDTYDLSFDSGLSITDSEVRRGISDSSDPHYYTNIVDATISNGVIRIDNSVLYGSTSLTSVTIPDSVTSIGSQAFYSCTSLTSVTIPDSVTSIGSIAFGQCTDLTYISVGSGNTVYDSRNNCNAIIETGTNKLIVGCSNTVIPNTVTSIGTQAFYYLSTLTSIVIPDSVTSIEDWAFNSCSSLASVTIGNGVTSIGERAFGGCESLTSVTIPDGVTTIKKYSFGNCSNLETVILGDSTANIQESAFDNCRKLRNIELPDSLKTIGKYAFGFCDLREVTIPSGCYALYEQAFRWCENISRITIPSSVNTIGKNSFLGCQFTDSNFINNSSATGSPWGATIYQNTVEQNGLIISTDGTTLYKARPYLTSVTIPNTVTSIGTYAFNGCSSLTSVTIPNAVTTIGNSAFNGCTSLTSITIPDSVTSIDNYAFNACIALTSVTIGNGVTSIGIGTFQNCTGLTSVTIGNGVTSINDSAFSYCTSLTNLTCEATTPPTLGSSALNYTNNCPIYVPAESVETYKSASVWSDYASRIQAIPTE